MGTLGEKVVENGQKSVFLSIFSFFWGGCQIFFLQNCSAEVFFGNCSISDHPAQLRNNQGPNLPDSFSIDLLTTSWLIPESYVHSPLPVISHIFASPLPFSHSGFRNRRPAHRNVGHQTAPQHFVGTPNGYYDHGRKRKSEVGRCAAVNRLAAWKTDWRNRQAEKMMAQAGIPVLRPGFCLRVRSTLLGRGLDCIESKFGQWNF